MEIDLNLIGTPLAELSRRSLELQALGADGLFSAEGPHDAFAPLFLAAASAPGLAVMTNAAIAFPRNPIHLAHSAFDLAELSGGRFRLGIAPQVAAHITRRFGLEWSDPLGRMEDLLGALRAIFSTWQQGEALRHEGPYYRHVLMTPMFSPPPLETGPPPVILGALGPKMTELAGRCADGLSVLPFCSAELLEEQSLPAFERGLDAAGRSRDEVELVCGAIVAVHADEEEEAAARAGLRALLGFYGSTPAYRRVLASIGREDAAAPLSAAVRVGDFGALGELVDDELVERLGFLGTPEEVADRLVGRFGGRADRISVFQPAQPSDSTVARLLAAIRSRQGR